MKLALAIASICLTASQDPTDEIGRAILQLLDDDAQVRAKAEATLLSLGTKAIPALREACTSANSRTREDAQRLFARIDRVEFEKFHDAMNRQSVMALRSVDDFQKALSI